MRFVFLGPGLCLQLPSDPASRRTPLLLASGSRHQGPQGTSTPKSLPDSVSLLGYPAPGTLPGVARHAWRTTAEGGDKLRPSSGPPSEIMEGGSLPAPFGSSPLRLLISGAVVPRPP